MAHSYAPYFSDNMVVPDANLVASLMPQHELIERSYSIARECWGGIETETCIEFIGGGAVVHFELNGSTQTIYYNQEDHPYRVIHNGVAVS